MEKFVSFGLETLISLGLLWLAVGAFIIAAIALFFTLANNRFKSLDQRIGHLEQGQKQLEQGQKEILSMIKDMFALINKEKSK